MVYPIWSVFQDFDFSKIWKFNSLNLVVLVLCSVLLTLFSVYPLVCSVYGITKWVCVHVLNKPGFFFVFVNTKYSHG